MYYMMDTLWKYLPFVLALVGAFAVMGSGLIYTVSYFRKENARTAKG